MVEKVFEVPKDWVTFATQYKRESIGTAEITTKQYKPGFYLMEGIKGYVMWHNKYTLYYTSLSIDRKQWMLDDPLHWIGMQELAKSTSGRVLVAGLGLGLVVSQLIENPKVTEIVVVERNSDVIKLVGKYLQSPKVTIVESDFRQYVQHLLGEIYKHTMYKDTDTQISLDDVREKMFDYAILDLWVANEKSTSQERKMIQDEMRILTGLCVGSLKDKVYIWGVNDKTFNPAFEDSEDLRMLKREMMERR